MSVLYSFCTTTIIYALPDEIIENYQFSWSEDLFDVEKSTSTSNQIQTDIKDIVEKERKAPFVNTVTLIFYSGNLVVDLLLNFITALPSMVILLVSAFMFLFNVDSYLALQIKMTIGAILTVTYLAGLINVLVSFRSAGVRVS
ncbi:MAG: hypothetical protein V3U92_19650 [Cellulophaga sp.]